MAAWEDALLRLHDGGWGGELIDEACRALAEACEEGPLQGRALFELSRDEVSNVLREPITGEETHALCIAAAAHQRADAEGGRLRAALVDLDAFVASLRDEPVSGSALGVATPPGQHEGGRGGSGGPGRG